MAQHWIRKPKVIVYIPLWLALALAIACGAAAKATPIATGTPPPTATTASPGATAVPAATPKPSPTPTVAAAVGKYGGIIPMHDYAFPNVNFTPHETLEQIKNFSPIYNQLLEYDPETDDLFDIRGDLAKSWELGPDGATYTFHLHENARWHDGTPLTAEDVVFSLDSMADTDAYRPQTGIIQAYYAKGNSRVIDEHTVEVKIKAPAADFLPVLASDLFKIIAKHWVESGIDTKTWENAMGSGPFKPGKLTKDVSIELEKNPDYFKKGRPYLDGMKHIAIVDKGTAIAAYKTEQVLMTNWPVTQLSNKDALKLQEEEKGHLTVHFIPNGSVLGMIINTRIKPFDDPRVRRALFLTFQRPEFREVFGAGIASMGVPMPPGTWFGRTEEELKQLPGFRETADGKKHPDDIAEAQRLLADAGYPKGFKVNMMARTVLEFVDLGQFEADQMRKFLNIDVTIETVPSAIGLTRYGKGDYVIAPQGNAPLTPTPDSVIQRMWLPEGVFGPWTGWQPPPKFIELFKKQSVELDQTKRKAIIREIEDFIINEDPGGFIPLYWNKRDWIVNNKIKNFHNAPTFASQLKHEHLWCDPKC